MRRHEPFPLGFVCGTLPAIIETRWDSPSCSLKNETTNEKNNNIDRDSNLSYLRSCIIPGYHGFCAARCGKNMTLGHVGVIPSGAPGLSLGRQQCRHRTCGRFVSSPAARYVSPIHERFRRPLWRCDGVFLAWCEHWSVGATCRSRALSQFALSGHLVQRADRTDRFGWFLARRLAHACGCFRVWCLSLVLAVDLPL